MNTNTSQRNDCKLRFQKKNLRDVELCYYIIDLLPYKITHLRGKYQLLCGLNIVQKILKSSCWFQG